MSDFEGEFLLACAEVEAEAEAYVQERAERVVQVAQSHLPPGGMRDAVRTRPGKDAGGPYVDAGIIPGSGKVTDWHGHRGAKVDEVAVPLEFGHKDQGVHVPAHPFMRPGMAVVEADA